VATRGGGGEEYLKDGTVLRRLNDHREGLRGRNFVLKSGTRGHGEGGKRNT